MKKKTKLISQNLEDLRKFKAGKEQEEFKFAVNMTLKEIEENVEIPGTELELIREEANKCNLGTIDAWKNFAKGRALDFAIRGDGKKNVVTYGLPWFQKPKDAGNGSLWVRE